MRLGVWRRSARMAFEVRSTAAVSTHSGEMAPCATPRACSASILFARRMAQPTASSSFSGPSRKIRVASVSTYEASVVPVRRSLYLDPRAARTPDGQFPGTCPAANVRGRDPGGTASLGGRAERAGDRAAAPLTTARSRRRRSARCGRGAPSGRRRPSPRACTPRTRHARPPRAGARAARACSRRPSRRSSPRAAARCARRAPGPRAARGRRRRRCRRRGGGWAAPPRRSRPGSRRRSPR
ncbi:uncharacterized protein SOCE26_072030 [Sorangium cellulosum]|uniref:Uncharacterized protein n=1 Tax=Sorangium cellulosum TaxID=56 RepID=A0A2L0F2D6_SORCE|nr:uncharacterized protein SOCE26_072030 [Sorangium cellulosum]